MRRLASVASAMKKSVWSVYGVVVAIGLFCGQGHGQQQLSSPGISAKAPAVVRSSAPLAPSLIARQRRSAQRNYLRQPLTFQPNVGQSDKRVQFLSQGEGYSLFLTPADAVLSLATPPAKSLRGKITSGQSATLEMVAIGADSAAIATGLDPENSHTNYLIGNDPKQWHENVANFARVKYAGIYPGIDLTYYGNHSQLEYDFVVAPGADPGKIKLQFKGMQSLRLDNQGAALIETAAGPVRLAPPVLYQPEPNGARQPVSGQFLLANNEIRFHVGNYDKGKPLVIDPIIGFSTFLGGSGQENFALGHVGNFVSGIAVDGTGASYITGTSTSVTDFPFAGQQNAATPLVPNAIYGFVAKFDSKGNLVYSTFLGGRTFYSYTSEAAVPGGIAVDSTGHAYITGYTTTHDFPVNTSIAYQGSPYGNGYTGVMGFVTKLDPSGGFNLNQKAYSTYIYSDIYGSLDADCGGLTGVCGTDDNGVGGYTYPTAIAVDAQDHAYITGAFDPFFAWAYSDGKNFMPNMNQRTASEDLV